MGLPSRQCVIARPILLKDEPHTTHIFAGVSPVTPSIQISKVKFLLTSELDRGYRTRDLSRDKGFAANRALMIEQNPADKRALFRSVE